MTTAPFFTVIMPVYNGAKCVSKAIDSVLQQTFKDFELIIVNDGSADDTLSICQKHAEKDKRIIVYSIIVNSGLSNARNEAIKHVKGQYFTFIDADDYIESDLLERTYLSIKKYNPDFVKFGLYEEYYDKFGKLKHRKKVVAPKEFISDSVSIKKRIVAWETLPIFGYTWNTIYKTELVKHLNLKFEEYKMIEDFLYNLSYFSNIDNGVMLDLPLYHYTKSDNQSLSSRQVDEYFDVYSFKIQQLLNKYLEWNLLDEAIQQRIYWLYTRYVYSAVCRVIKLNGGKAARQELENIFNTELFEQYKDVRFVNCSNKERIMINSLQKQKSNRVLFLCKTMNFVKDNFQVIFALIKG